MRIRKGIRVAAVVTVGALVCCTAGCANPKKEEAKQTVEKDVGQETKVEEEEKEPIEKYGWEKLEGTHAFFYGADMEEDGGYKVVIDNLVAESEAESDVTFDMEFQYYPGDNAEPEIMKHTGVGISEKYIEFQEMLGDVDWYASFYVMKNKSLVMSGDRIDASGGSTLNYEDTFILTKEAVEQSDIKTLEEGEYTYTTGTDAYTDGGFALSVREVEGEAGDQKFQMTFSIISEGGEKVDELYLDSTTGGNVATFQGTTGWLNYIIGYFVVQDDGSIALSYETKGMNEEMVWYGAYPDSTEEPIVLTK